MGRGRPKEFDPDVALDEAMKLFWEQGYEATGMAALVEHTGVPRQSLYRLFPDKRSLFLAALDRYGETRLAAIAARLDAPGDPLANIHAVLDLWLAGATAPRNPGCFVCNTMTEFGDADPDVVALVRANRKRVEDGFYRALRRAGVERPRRLARFFVGIGYSVSALSRLGEGRAAVRDVVESARSLLPA